MAWHECKRPVYRYARQYMEKRQKPLTQIVGGEFTMFKVKQLHDNMSIF